MTLPPNKNLEYVYNPSDGSVLLDHKGRPLSVDKLLATKPLRGELSTRPGPGNKKLTYISGDGVSRTMNDIFGFDGWNLDIVKVQREECVQMNSKYHVVYTAQVRLTHKASGAYKEDCGAGDAVDRSIGAAIAHAIKSSITDAMKRAARHFGDKLGNSLYQGNFSINKAPTTLKDALDNYDIERANSKFGFPKDQIYKTSKENLQPAKPKVVQQQSSLQSTTNVRAQPENVHGPSATKTDTSNQSFSQAFADTMIPFSYTEKESSISVQRPVSSRGRPSGDAIPNKKQRLSANPYANTSR